MVSKVDYFQRLENGVREFYSAAQEARKKGFDPIPDVEILLASNMNERVEALISVVAPQMKGVGLVERLAALEKEFGVQDWKVAFRIALEVAQEKFCKFKDEREAMEVGLRAGLAYITNGVVASPLEGFVRLELKKRKDGKEYFCLFFSGPIRSAGTTANCIFVALADYVRKEMGYSPYDPTKEEIKRMSTELYDFHERITNLQYLPSVEEIEFMVSNLPVQIDGDPSEKREVSNYKDLPRIKTNVLRNGVCLVIAEGLTQKAAKFWGKFNQWCRDFGIKHWDFMEKFIKLQKKIRAKEKVDGGEDVKVLPDYTFIHDVVAGRPVLTHPLRVGGFRLRYGRCRNSGFSSVAIHPATMHILDRFIAIGTQLKMERPGKATVIASCDSIEGPIVKLNNGDVVFIDSVEEAKKYAGDVEEILFVGDMLINYGDFLDRAHKLIPCGYNEDWYLVELKSKGFKGGVVGMGFGDASKLCEKLNVPMHPKFTFHWKDVEIGQLKSLLEFMRKAVIEEGKVILPFVYDLSSDVEGGDPKRILELLGVPHRVVKKEYIAIEGDYAKAFVHSLGLNEKNADELIGLLDGKVDWDVLRIVNSFSDFELRDKSGYFIGCRMGRPEKAKMRKLTGSPQVIFPVGNEGGRLRCFQSALEKGKITADFPVYCCKKCGKDTVYKVCEACGGETEKRYYCRKCGDFLSEKECPEHGDAMLYRNREIDIDHYFKLAVKKAGLNGNNVPELVKGVRGTSNEDHDPENLVKGILRAKHGLYVNKDGTVRYDMIETALTAFRPFEIGTSVEKLKEMGYDKDIYGNKLERDDQVVELKVQDIVLPSPDDSDEEGADEILFRVGCFVDDLLKNLYGVKKVYNFKKKEDVVGSLVVSMSPHTLAGAVARVIGFSKTQGFYAHPMLHCLMRRDCDGDEAGIMLLMDALLNFSRKYLSTHRGAVQDAPLVLTYKLIPTEVDDMVFKMDVVFEYPLEFYQACEEYKSPWDIKIETVNDRLGLEDPYSCYGFTHDVGDINSGVTCSEYKILPTMGEKVQGQMRLAEKIRAVDENDVARLLIERHFIRDIKGNLRKFSIQQFRCVGCNMKFRRPPLIGKCGCGGKIIFTIAEGSVVKYLEPSLQIAEKYDLPSYLRQSLDLLKDRIEGVFGKDKDKQEALGKWF